MQLVALFVALLGLASQQALADSMGVDLSGIENCPNKCEKVFDRTQYAISDQPGADTFEYRSCLLGCNRCATELSQGSTDDTCFQWCKRFNYKRSGIRKGVIEPDKACIMGCVINTCQSVCTGGTTDFYETPANKLLFWGNEGSTGCSIKGRLGYVQNPSYGNPSAGQGASTAQRACCTNAFNLCNYVGDTSNTNYANVLLVSQRSCRGFAASTSPQDICTFYNNPQNCGEPGMGPLLQA